MGDERIAVLETKVSALQEKDAAILAKLDSIERTISKQKGFIGGIVFMVSCLATAFGMAHDSIMGLFR